MADREKAKKLILNIVQCVDYDIYKGLKDPENSEDPEHHEAWLEELIDIIEDEIK